MRDLDRYQADYATLPFEAIQAAYRRRRVLENLPRHGGRHVLEVGCGTEPLFLHYPGFRTMHVVEPAQEFHAKALAAAAGKPGVTVLLGTLQQLVPVLEKHSFDCVVMSSLLHELADPQALLTSARRLCAKDTTLHIYLPNANSFHRLLALEMGLIKDIHELSATQAKMQQAATYDRETLHALLEDSGFSIIESGSFFIKPFTHVQMAALREQGLLTDAMLDGLYAMSRHLPDIGSELYAIARKKP
ncbi:MAG: methyltransferase domain-containing protein [Betaproteobacteria bacterium]